MVIPAFRSLAAGVLAVPLQLTPSQAQPLRPPAAPDCAGLTAAASPAALALCGGEEEWRRATAAQAGSDEQAARLRAAADQFARVAASDEGDLKVYALEMTVLVYDVSHLNEPANVEQALRELARTIVGTPAPLVRLARFQEQQGAETAEETLLGARQQFADRVETLRELSGFYARRVMAGKRRDAPASDQTTMPKPPAYRPDCREFSFGGPTSGLAMLCAAEVEMRKAGEVPRADGALARARAAEERKQHLRAAAQYYEKAAGLLTEREARIFAYEAAARAYGKGNLNDPAHAELAIRQLFPLQPMSTAPILTLAALQEEHNLTEAAEATLVGARQQFPNDVALLKALSLFFGRLATAAHTAEYRRQHQDDPPVPPGHPDAQGFYTVGGAVAAPKVADDRRPHMPEEALAVGMSGVVTLELRVDESGRVADVAVVNSAALLDDAAIAAAGQWRFEPATLGGKAVPVRVTVEMTFTIR